ncbi:MAG: class I SAM-dependent methyltransferase [Acidimicrobiia bacterium]|nr:class I SAM-dependent methyltransferase [Acidimicrobiia bacterium]
MAEPGKGVSPPAHWFEPVAEHLGPAYLRYSFTKGTVQEVDALSAMLDLDPGCRILDVGCGPGRHSLELARRGHEVTGVDISSTFVELAARAAVDGGLDAQTRFVLGDARKLDELDLGSFDLVISLCQGAFGLSGGPTAVNDGLGPPVELDEPILTAMVAAMADGGRLVVSAFSAYFQLRHTDTDQPNGAPSDGLPAESFDADGGVNHEWTTILDSDGQPRTTELWTTCYTPRELRLLARVAGLRVEAVHGVTPGDYGPHPPDIDRPEFLLIASRATQNER